MSRLRTAYFIVANTALLVLLVLAGTDVAIRMFEDPPRTTYRTLIEPVRRNYAHMSPADVDELWRDTESIRFRYAPVLGFVEDVTTSKFVNIDANGIRSNGSGPRDVRVMQDAIWFLGGSTALGYGVADHETIPAHLENILGRPVMNLGVRAHASSTENHLLHQYLRFGYQPSIALFLDGMNETCDLDPFADELSALIARTQHGYTWEFGRPVSYAYARLSRNLKHMLGVAVPAPERRELTCVSTGTRNPLRTIHARTLAERAALCDLYKIACRTFVQPFAGLHGRHDDDRFVGGVDAQDLRIVFNHLKPNWRAAGAIFITDALDRSDRHAFVDIVHYSADASRLIAEAIALKLRSAGATTAAAPPAAPQP